MADDILDDLEDEFEDDVEDILGETSLDDPESDMDDFESDDMGDETLEEEDLEDSALSDKKISIKQLLSKVEAKIPGKLKTRKALIILAVSLLIFFVLIVGLLFFFTGGGEKEEQIVEQNQAAIGQTSIQQQEIIFEDIVELEPFERIKLKTSSTMGLISLNISLELTDGRYRRQIYSMEDRLRNIVESQVAEMTWLELRNPEGKIRLKYELLKRMNALFPKATVRNIYFTYFIMQ